MAIGARALRAGKAVIELGLLVKPVEKQLKNLQNRLTQIGRSFVRIGSFGMFGGGGGFAALRNLFVGSAAAAALAYPIKLAANLELATAQLSTFTDSEESAGDILKDLQKFSGSAMIPFSNLADAAGMLIRFGVAQRQVAMHSKAMAVISAGNADEFDKLALAFAQVASAGRLQGEELRQLKNTAFNPIREIAERTGETMDEVRVRMEAGQISFQEVANALQAAVGPGGRFEHLLALISQTASGQFSKALAQIKTGLQPIGEQFLGMITTVLKAFNGVIPKVLNMVNMFVTLFIMHFKMMHTEVVRVMQGIADALMAGNISLAGKVLWLGLKVAWQEGTDGLMETWIKFKNKFMLSLVNLGAEMEKKWVQALSKIKNKTTSKLFDLGLFVAGLGKTPEQKKRLSFLNDLAKGHFTGKQSSATAKRVAGIEKEQGAARKIFEGKTSSELRAARKELEESKTALSAATDEAATQAKIAQNQIEDFGLGEQFPLTALAGLDKAKDTFKQPEAFFDTRLVRQALSGPRDAELHELRKIERNTRNGGGLPVV